MSVVLEVNNNKIQNMEKKDVQYEYDDVAEHNILRRIT